MKRRQEANDDSVRKRAKQIYDQRQRAVNAARDAAAVSGAYATPPSSNSNALLGNGDNSSNNGTPFMPDMYMVSKLEECVVILTREERDQKKNLCIVGPAGTGKSWLVRNLSKALESLSKIVAVLAATGTAAINVDGQTCDAFFGLSPDMRKLALRDLVTKVDEHGIRAKLQSLHVLIIDEISMVSHEFMMQMDAVMKEGRNSTEPFGGVRVVVVGDFAQLPPVKPQQFCHVHGLERYSNGKRRGLLCCRGCEIEAERAGISYDGAPSKDMWAFKAPVWTQLRFEPILLTKLLRQTCPKLKEIVVSMFMGKELTTGQIDLLRSRTNASTTSIRLYCLRCSADEYNKQRKQEMTEPDVTFTALDNYSGHPTHAYLAHRRLDYIDPGTSYLTMLRDHKLCEKLTFCKGMPVVLLSNINPTLGLVNGLQGTIVDWQYINAEDLPRISDGMLTSGYEYSSIGRSQSAYLPSIMNAHYTRRQNRVRAFMHDERNNGKPWPVVHFANGVERVIIPDCVSEDWTYDDDVSTFSRTQLPLLPAWALTIHRAQGMTLVDYVADLSGAFCAGLEYVALSRGPSLERMEVLGLKGKLKHGMDPTVAKFMKDTFPDLEAQMAQGG
ncbi:hypothetical protein AMS68_007184 [Peltaster fructicola]|uniref:ATP-dependent DNA helicase n=1 Tax=Peltaster fructicola TaxID=286661 RepID=A0A6H0Y3S2_9PEZI|nr:hypothetical protein AMS68_007184 [Peltaster fructicola]